ncbi:tetratricopeptide (TPR) repeat protein [Marmoricola sp. URHA0025 HA25]
MTDHATLWDFDDPSGSEDRFRAAAEAADGADRLVLLTQVARSLGLQERYAEAHALLDDLDTGSSPEVDVRVGLERGRLLNSSGDPEAALPLFRAAAESADAAGLEALAIDARHMVAIAAPADQRLGLNKDTLARARAATARDARDWDASLLNNIGMCHVDAGDLDAALAAFEEALVALERIGDRGRILVGRWMVAWVLRLQGRTAEALAAQQALKAELDARGQADPYVDEELALLEAGEVSPSPDR